jgi:hypothetical protein
MRWPLDPALLNATVFSQWVLLEPGVNALGLTTTNAVEVQLSGNASTTGFAIVTTQDPTSPTGMVLTHFFPALRLVK